MTLRWIDHRLGGEPIARPSKVRLHAKLRLVDAGDLTGPSYGHVQRINTGGWGWQVYSPWIVNLGVRRTLGGAAKLLKRHAERANYGTGG